MPIKYSRMVQQSMGVSSGSSADRPTSPSVGEQFVNGTLGITEVYTEENGWQPLTSSSTGIAYGTNADRPANPELGQPYFNADEARLELYTTATGWQNIVQETPSVVSIVGTYFEGNASNTIAINGTNFSAGAIAYAVGTDGVEIQADVTTLGSVVEISATFSGLNPANEPYDIKVVNPSNLYGVLYEALQVDDLPVFITQSGTLGTYIEESPLSVQISATDDENASLIFSITSGALPTGLSLNTSTGEISGTPADVIPNTTYSFNISATDGNNTASRSFSITINDRGPTWSTSETLSPFSKNIAYNETLVAVDDNLQTLSYSLVSGSLPTALSLNSATGEISGTPTSSAVAIFTVRATEPDGTFSDRQFTIPNTGPVWQTASGLQVFSSTQNNIQLIAQDDGVVTYSLASGTLPAGISLSSSGVLSGLSSETATSSTTFTIAATDENGVAANRQFTAITDPEVEFGPNEFTPPQSNNISSSSTRYFVSYGFKNTGSDFIYSGHEVYSLGDPAYSNGGAVITQSGGTYKIDVYVGSTPSLMTLQATSQQFIANSESYLDHRDLFAVTVPSGQYLGIVYYGDNDGKTLGFYSGASTDSTQYDMLGSLDGYSLQTDNSFTRLSFQDTYASVSNPFTYGSPQGSQWKFFIKGIPL